jgi:chromosome segregation ATPase
MSLEPEILAAIQEAVKGTITEVVKPLSEQLEKVQYDNGKLTEALTGLSTSIPSQLDERFGAINPTLEFLNELRKEAEAEQQEKPKKQSEIDAALVKAKQEYEAKFNQLQRELEERDKEAQALREADRKSRMRNDVLAQMRSLQTVRPNTEEDLLTLLEKRGLIVEDGDKFFVKSTDKFGGQVNAEFKDILPKMLESDFAHFAVPRGGTGTDGQPGNRTQTTTSQYDFEKMSAQEIYDTYSKDPEAMKAYNQLLEQQFGKA